MQRWPLCLVLLPAITVKHGTAAQACANRLHEELDEHGNLRPEVAARDVSAYNSAAAIVLWLAEQCVQAGLVPRAGHCWRAAPA